MLTIKKTTAGEGEQLSFRFR